MDRLLKVAELATLLRTTPNGVYIRLKRCSQSVPAPLLIPGSTCLRWRQSDVEAWLAALPTRATGRKPPRRRACKTPALTGVLAGWEPYLSAEKLNKIRRSI